MHQHSYARAAQVLLVLSCSVAPLALQAQPLTRDFTTDKGAIRCSEQRGAVACLGIPYAAAPIGPLRFMPPAPAAAWTSVRDATRFGSNCLQARTEYTKQQEGTEDCLYLNVYKPAVANPDSKLPVMVWLHGGGFVNGSGNAFNGAYLANTANAIVVTLNYRLGPFGWLALPSLATEQKDGTTGNYGLLDSIAALRWVRANIEALGGDHDRVTLFGQSAGGEQAFALLASPYAAGLFQRAISMSAPATLRLPSIDQAAAKRGELLSTVGCMEEATQATCLRSVDAQKLLDSAHISWDLLHQYGLQYTPTVDGAVLPDQWLSRFRAGDYNRMPIIIGHTREEGRLFVAINENVNSRPMTNDYVESRLKGFYGPASFVVGDVYSKEAFPDPADRIARGIVDSLFAAGLSADKDALSKQSNVFAYEWCDPDAAESHVHAKYMTLGCAHDADLPYLFQWDDFDGSQPHFNAGQEELAIQTGKYFGNFAATGDPNGTGLPKWPIYQTANQKILLLEPAETGGIRTLSDGAYPQEHKLWFWNTLGALRRPGTLVAIAATALALLAGLFLLFRRHQQHK